MAYALVIVAAILLGWSRSIPGDPVLLGSFAVVVTVIAAGYLIILGVRSILRRTLVWSVIVAAIVLVGLGLVAQSGWVLQARFAGSADNFARVVKDQSPPDDGIWTGPCPDRIGSYVISRCAAVGTGFLYYLPDEPLYEPAGFAYLPDGPEGAQRAQSGDSSMTLPAPIRYRRLSGAWYAFEDPWG